MNAVLDSPHDVKLGEGIVGVVARRDLDKPEIERCLYCFADLAPRRAGRRPVFCNPKCRTAFRRENLRRRQLRAAAGLEVSTPKPKRKPKLPPVAQTRPGYCARCGERLPLQGRGRPRKYCPGKCGGKPVRKR